MAKIIQVPYKSDIVIPVETAQSVQANREKPISLEALGLLVNLLSYPITWELHKTELYQRFAKNKETSVRKAWKELMEANYIIEFKYRVGKKWEYVYYFRKVPFSPEEKAEILENARNEYGEIWGLDFQDLKMKSSKSRGNQIPKSNKKPKLKDKDKYKDYIDDDKRTSQQVAEDSPTHDEESINLIISNLREATKNDLKESSFKAVVKKVIDKYNQGKIGAGNFRSYLVAALANKIEELEERREKDRSKAKIKESKEERVQKRREQLEQQPVLQDVPKEDWFKVFSELVGA